MEVVQTPKRRWVTSFCALALSGGLAMATPAYSQNAAPAPDNSAHNKGQQVTADQQSGHPSDREMTAEIRRSLVGDKSLSTYAHNVKIITKNGAVTLKGPVHSDEEKQAVAGKAAAVAGQDKVTNELTVKQ